MVWFPFVGDIYFGVKPNLKSRIRPLALHPMLALHPPPVKGKFPGMSLSLGIVIDQGMPRTRGLLGGPQIMGVDCLGSHRQAKTARVQATLMFQCSNLPYNTLE